MLREIDLSEVSDGRLYTSNDLAKTDCGGCKGCSSCCREMGNSIVLDPYDIYQLTKGLSKNFEELLTVFLELNVADGIILPNLRMSGTQESCTFLNADGRCSIHDIRPGFCRLFPLGRIYEDHGFRYFLQVHECPKPGKTKVRIKKWLDIPNLRQYEAFITDWHYYLKERQEHAMAAEDAETVKALSMEILRTFYLQPYDTTADFYPQFYDRLHSSCTI